MDTQDPTPLHDGDVVETEVTAEPEQVEPEVTEPEAQQEDAGDDSDGISLEDFAAYTGLESDRLDVNEEGQILAKVKINGEESSVPLTDVITTYQKAEHLRKETTEVENLKKSLKSQLAEVQTKAQEQLADKFQLAEDLITLSWQELQAEAQNPDLTQLKEDDPGAYAARVVDLQSKEKSLVDRYNKLVEARKAAQPDLTQARAEVGRKLMEIIPEWSDPKVRDKDLTDINQYALQNGYTQDVINRMVNHNDFLLLRKSMLYDRLQDEKPNVTNVVRKVKKIVKPGAKSVPRKQLTAEQILYGSN